MKVVHLTSEIGGGGAARSALNLHQGLLRCGINSTILTGHIHGEIPVGVVKIPEISNAEREFVEACDILVWNNRSNRSNTHFSLNLPGWDPSGCDLLINADVINLHWVAGALSASSISALGLLGKPIVWTLHDMRPLSGGCHFPAGCQGFASDCRDCPQLLDDLCGLTAKNKLLLDGAVENACIHFVAPSSWMMEQAIRAKSRRNNILSLIPYGIDSIHFDLGDKLTARQKLGLHPKATYILLAAQHNMERRKGFDEAIEILQTLRQKSEIAQLIANGSVRILLCGHNTGEIEISGYMVDRVGHLVYDSMPYLYNAADLLLFTSLEDNLPNVLMEALSCGLPVVAHDLGGVRDLIGQNGDAGFAFPVSDFNQASLLITNILFDKTKKQKIGQKARERMETEFSLEKQAQEYIEVYRDLMDKECRKMNSNIVLAKDEFRVLNDSLICKLVDCEKVVLERNQFLRQRNQFLEERNQLLRERNLADSTYKNENSQIKKELLELKKDFEILSASKIVRIGQILGICRKP
jgi:glycosyltransferase involved in cell wall biosynthesis